MKSCLNPDCSQTNPQALSCFHKDSGKKDGLKNKCKICCIAYKKQWISKNTDRNTNNQKVWRDSNKEYIKLLISRYPFKE